VPFNGIIMAVAATDRRQDTGLLTPMVGQTEKRTGRAVATALADMGYADHDDIATLATREQKPVTTYVPRKRPPMTTAVADWRLARSA
jgi:hypothetical protein